MFTNPAVVWVLTAVLLFSGSYHAFRGARSRHLTVQANQTLHALMNLMMAAMLWNLAPSAMLAQIGILAGAALWFIIQAVARPEFQLLCDVSQSRLKCVYHSLSMGGAALMIALMGRSTTATHEDTVPSGSASMPSMPSTHHAMSNAGQGLPAPIFDAHALAVLSTIFFTAAAALFLILLLRTGLNKNIRHAARTQFAPHADHGMEALSAATMALMFTTMTA